MIMKTKKILLMVLLIMSALNYLVTPFLLMEYYSTALLISWGVSAGVIYYTAVAYIKLSEASNISN
jgi:amino acid transporter